MKFENPFMSEFIECYCGDESVGISGNNAENTVLILFEDYTDAEDRIQILLCYAEIKENERFEAEADKKHYEEWKEENEVLE